MAKALDIAWTRSLEGAEASGRQRQSQAAQTVAETWLASAPTLELSQREGNNAAAAGSSETELSVALPLWRFGQRQQNTEFAQAEFNWASAAERAARLRLALQLRDNASGVRFAEADAQQAAEQRQLLEALHADVERRVKAGDLSAADAMAAKAEMLAARTQEHQAQQALAKQRSTWMLLTGLSEIPEPEIAAERATGELSQHPEALLAEAVVQRTRQRVAQVVATREAPPELGIGLRREQPGSGQPSHNSVAVSLRLPLGRGTHSQPQLAAALAEQDLALMTQQRLRLQLEADLALAHSQLSASASQAQAEGERATLLRERAQLLKRAFLAGEASLPELLRAMSAAAQADSAAARQKATLAQSSARLQQALGQLP